MSIAATVNQSLKQFQPGEVFGYGDLSVYQQSPNTVVKAISRLVKSNRVKKLGKGLFYLPKHGVLGELRPSDSELLKSLQYKNGKRRAYITGSSLYNQLGISTQIPKTVDLATEGAPQMKNFGTIRARLVRSRAPVKEVDILLLQYLDVLKTARKVSGVSVDYVAEVMLLKLDSLTDDQLVRIQVIADEYYPASTRAFLCMLLSRMNRRVISRLKSSLNPLSHYTLGLSQTLWPECKEWNIK